MHLAKTEKGTVFVSSSTKTSPHMAIFWCWSSREKKEKKRKKRKEGKEKKRRGKGEKEGKRWTCLEYKYFS